jgi:hypothetical protein
MIDKEQFAAGMALLAGAYGREIDGPVQRMYFGILSAKLTTEEFQQALKDTMATETFWPSPAVILSKVPRLREDRPARALEHVNRVLSAHGGHRFLSYDTYHTEFDAPTKAAIAAVGGLSAITSCTEERYAGLSKRFTNAFREFEASPPAIDRVDRKALAAGE